MCCPAAQSDTVAYRRGEDVAYRERCPLRGRSHEVRRPPPPGGPTVKQLAEAKRFGEFAGCEPISGRGQSHVDRSRQSRPANSPPRGGLTTPLLPQHSLRPDVRERRQPPKHRRDFSALLSFQEISGKDRSPLTQNDGYNHFPFFRGQPVLRGHFHEHLVGDQRGGAEQELGEGDEPGLRGN